LVGFRGDAASNITTYYKLLCESLNLSISKSIQMVIYFYWPNLKYKSIKKLPLTLLNRDSKGFVIQELLIAYLQELLIAYRQMRRSFRDNWSWPLNLMVNCLSWWIQKLCESNSRAGAKKLVITCLFRRTAGYEDPPLRYDKNCFQIL
jgi:hypothetical protein